MTDSLDDIGMATMDAHDPGQHELSEADKITVMKVFFTEYDRLRQSGENAPYSCFMAERARLVAYNRIKAQKVA